MNTVPTLLLRPVSANAEDTAPFVPKSLRLSPGNRVVIGRTTCPSVSPDAIDVAPRPDDKNEKRDEADNGWFPSKTMSRAHAELWAEDDKIFLKDTKSINGTYVNGERLSEESFESAPKELKTNDILVLGIDVFNEDRSDILYHKISARVECVASENGSGPTL